MVLSLSLGSIADLGPRYPAVTDCRHRLAPTKKINEMFRSLQHQGFIRIFSKGQEIRGIAESVAQAEGFPAQNKS